MKINNIISPSLLLFIFITFIIILVPSTYGFNDCALIKCAGIEKTICEELGGHFHDYNPEEGACCSYCLKNGLALNAYSLEWIDS